MWSGPGLTTALANTNLNTTLSKEMREAFSRYKAQREDSESGTTTPRSGQWGPFTPQDAFSPNRRRNLVDMIQEVSYW
jgi:hypothetical protein